MRVYVPADTSACSLGADGVAVALESEARRRGLDIELIRNGSRGAVWLEPLVEVEDAQGRRGFGPVTEAAVPDLFDADFPAVGEHPLALGDIDALPWFAGQHRVTFARAGIGDPLDLDTYRCLGGLAGLEAALTLEAEDIVAEVTASGLRGRGGAAFPTGVKWRTVLDQPTGEKFICCNADEGDAGTFADRLLMEADPYQLLEGMIIAGLAVGAETGFIYLRSEYPRARHVLNLAIDRARRARLLGDNVLGSGKRFDVHLRIGAGAYICGEETSMLDSLEGKRGMVRYKPPLPAISGLFGKPTVVNNVLTLAAVSTILARGSAFYAELGQGRSRGTLTAQLGGNIRRGGLVECPFGVSIRDLIEGFGGGTTTGRPARTVQIGGPLGTYLPPDLWDTPLDYEALAAVGGMLGHGGLIVFDDTVDLAEQARFAMEFCAAESCGKCTPCRIGSVRGVELIDRIRANDNRSRHLALLDDLCETMEAGSLCAMGGLTPNPVRSAIKHYPEDFGLSQEAPHEAVKNP